MMSNSAIPINVRLRLGNNDIHYGDVFTMTYKWNPSKRVGYLRPNDSKLAEFDYEDQETQWCYFHDQDFKGLWIASWDDETNHPYINDNLYMKDPIIQKFDPYLVQRVSSLIMDDLVDYQIVKRYPTSFGTSIVQKVFELFLFPSRNGQKIGGIWDD